MTNVTFTNEQMMEMVEKYIIKETQYMNAEKLETIKEWNIEKDLVMTVFNNIENCFTNSLDAHKALTEYGFDKAIQEVFENVSDFAKKELIASNNVCDLANQLLLIKGRKFLQQFNNTLEILESFGIVEKQEEKTEGKPSLLILDSMTKFDREESCGIFLKQSAKYYFGLDLSIRGYDGNDGLEIQEFIGKQGGRNGGFHYIVTSLNKRLKNKHQKISYRAGLEKDVEELEGVLLHELSHWYCFNNDLQFRDGEDDFEKTLYRLNAPSTRVSSKNVALTKAVQLSKEGDRKLMGVSGVKIKTTTLKTKEMEELSDILEDGCESVFSDLDYFTEFKKLEIYYLGEYVGDMYRVKDRFGSSRFTSLELMKNSRKFPNRKSGIISMLNEYMG